jgi:hypothetical protein
MVAMVTSARLRVGGSQIPVLMYALHRRNHLDEFIQLTGEQVPTLAIVAREFQGFVLGQNENPANAGVDAVR